MKSFWVPPILMFLAACASTQTMEGPPTALASTDKLAQDDQGGESWTYSSPDADFRKYRTMIIDATMVYDGADAQFGNIPPEDRLRFAEILTEELRSEVGRSFPLVSEPGADTIRLTVTLLGAQRTTGGVATATRATPMGLAMHAVKSIADKPGTLTGSILVAVELKSAKQSELLAAAVRRITPDALDMRATLSTTDTVRSTARSLARRIREKLEEAAKSP